MSPGTVCIYSALITAFGALFAAMKLSGTVDWSWYWVLFPFYGPWLLCAFAAGAVLIYLGLCSLAKMITDPRAWQL